MSMSTTQIVGFSESVIEFIRNSQSDLSGMGINVENWLADMEKKRAAAVALNDEQEKTKAALRELTGRTEAAYSDLYDTTSTRLDAVIGSVGKKTELGKQAAKLRSKVKGVERKAKA